MKYGQIAGSNSINTMIYHCFEYICEEDERKFVKKFHEQPQDSDQIMHTFRELVLGAYLSSKGFKVRHDYMVCNKTPDWTILDDEGKSVAGIVELTNFHIGRATENEIEKQMSAKGFAGYWRDQNKDNVERLYHVIEDKASAYKSLVRKLRVPYVVSVFGELKAAVDSEEVRRCLFDEKTGFFGIYPELSGVLYFNDGYLFNYASNPHALQTIKVPDGTFTTEAT